MVHGDCYVTIILKLSTQNPSLSQPLEQGLLHNDHHGPRLNKYNANSAIHKAAGLSAPIQNGLWRSFLPVAPIHTQWDIFQWNDGMVE